MTTYKKHTRSWVYANGGVTTADEQFKKNSEIWKASPQNFKWHPLGLNCFYTAPLARISTKFTNNFLADRQSRHTRAKPSSHFACAIHSKAGKKIDLVEQRPPKTGQDVSFWLPVVRVLRHYHNTHTNRDVNTTGSNIKHHYLVHRTWYKHRKAAVGSHSSL